MIRRRQKLRYLGVCAAFVSQLAVPLVSSGQGVVPPVGIPSGFDAPPPAGGGSGPPPGPEPARAFYPLDELPPCLAEFADAPSLKPRSMLRLCLINGAHSRRVRRFLLDWQNVRGEVLRSLRKKIKEADQNPAWHPSYVALHRQKLPQIKRELQRAVRKWSRLQRFFVYQENAHKAPPPQSFRRATPTRATGIVSIATVIGGAALAAVGLAVLWMIRRSAASQHGFLDYLCTTVIRDTDARSLLADIAASRDERRHTEGPCGAWRYHWYNLVAAGEVAWHLMLFFAGSRAGRLLLRLEGMFRRRPS